MGWYDSFKGNTSRVNIAAMGSDSGSAFKNFGDAFSSIGKNMTDASAQNKKEEVLAAQKIKAERDAELLKTKNDQEIIDNAKKNKLSEVSKLDDAFKKDFNATDDVAYQKSLLEFEKPDGVFGSDVSNNAFEYAKQKIDAGELKAQALFNDKAVESSVTGGYTDMKKFVEKNPTLVKNADGVTMAKIDKYFADKDNSLNDIKNATKISKMQEKLNKDVAKKTATNKPLSVASQKAYTAMVNSLYMEKDISGNLKLKDGKTPEEVDFMQSYVNDYMSRPDSDKNVKNALEEAIAQYTPVQEKSVTPKDMILQDYLKSVL